MSTEDTLRKLLVLRELSETEAFKPFINWFELESEIRCLENEWRDEALYIIERNQERDAPSAELNGPAT